MESPLVLIGQGFSQISKSLSGPVEKFLHLVTTSAQVYLSVANPDTCVLSVFGRAEAGGNSEEKQRIPPRDIYRHIMRDLRQSCGGLACPPDPCSPALRNHSGRLKRPQCSAPGSKPEDQASAN